MEEQDRKNRHGYPHNSQRGLQARMKQLRVHFTAPGNSSLESGVLPDAGVLDV